MGLLFSFGKWNADEIYKISNILPSYNKKNKKAKQKPIAMPIKLYVFITEKILTMHFYQFLSTCDFSKVL